MSIIKKYRHKKVPNFINAQGKSKYCTIQLNAFIFKNLPKNKHAITLASRLDSVRMHHAKNGVVHARQPVDASQTTVKTCK